MKPRLLLVDDEQTVLHNLARLLQDYDCELALSAVDARQLLAEAGPFELILSDVNMPGISGIDLLEEVSRAYPDTATVMVTGVDDRLLAERALAMGAYGYVIKPYETNEILIAISNALRRRSLEIENKTHRDRLEQMVEERTADLWNAIRGLERADRDLRSSREETIRRLATAAEFRDEDTAHHVERMSRYCELLARRIGEDYGRCELLRTASKMHDVGKIGIPDSILLRPGKLESEDFEIMKKHPEIGYRILAGSDAEVLQTAATIAQTHHEWWNGAGYPGRLGEDEIPIEGRIAAIADVFDALTSNRVYRRAYSLGEAVHIMKEERGTHFDPTLLDAFFDSMDDVAAVRSKESPFTREPRPPAAAGR
jgi:putative two-component system response regulator